MNLNFLPDSFPDIQIVWTDYSGRVSFPYHRYQP